MPPQTGWYSDKHYFGLHFDFHADEDTSDIGAGLAVDELARLIALMGPDYVQADCKGHRGWTSWPTVTPTGTPAKGLQQNALQIWRAATAHLGLPLHCHYSGTWDMAAAERFPAWCVVDVDGVPMDRAYKKFWVNGAMSPFSPYVDELMLPQLRELIDTYQVNGFWVDGDIWACQADYGERAVIAFREQTGLAAVPRSPTDSHWETWMAFQRERFFQYVTHYCDTLHSEYPGIRVASNALYTFRCPGEPRVPTDWLSVDNHAMWGMDAARYEARFLSTRGRHWETMIWSFYKVGEHFDLAAPWTPKPVQMIQQETAITLAHGGNITLYENPQGLRNGRLVDWRMRRLGEVKTFVKARQAHCQHTETVPQVAVLHSEVDFFAGAEAPFPDKHKALGVQGAIFALLDLHYGVDVLDEWALLPNPDRFPVIVAPEVNRMSGAMVERLQAYVAAGGALVVSGAAALARFGADFFGVQTAEIVEDRVYFLSEGTLAVDVHSRQWALLTPGPAETFGTLGTSPLLTERLTGHPAAVLHHHGAGLVALVPYDIFGFFGRWHYPLLRHVIGRLMQPVTAGRLAIRVTQAPLCVDLVLRRRNHQLYVHAINRASGIPNSPQDAAIDEVPPVGPVVVEVDLPLAPVSVEVLFETAGLTWAHEGSTLRLTLERVHLHAAVLVECRAA